MSLYFFDSSALVKRYRPEAGTDEVNRLFTAPDATHYISRLAVVEVQRVFARRVRSGEIQEPELDRLRGLFYNDIGQRLLQVRRFRDFHYHNAVRLVRKYATPQKTPLLRTLDALHLVSALDLHRHQAQHPALGHLDALPFFPETAAAVVQTGIPRSFPPFLRKPLYFIVN